MLDAIYCAGGNLLEDVKIFDLYKGKPIAKDKKSVAFAFTFRSEKKSLKGSEVQKVYDDIVKNLKDSYKVEIREG